jgi:hypothetical protein
MPCYESLCGAEAANRSLREVWRGLVEPRSPLSIFPKCRLAETRLALLISLSDDEVGLLWALAMTEVHYPRVAEKRPSAASAASKLLRAIMGDTLGDAPRLGTANAEAR